MSFVIRLCLALWLFAFLAGASYAMGKEHDGAPLVAHSGNVSLDQR